MRIKNCCDGDVCAGKSVCIEMIKKSRKKVESKNKIKKRKERKRKKEKNSNTLQFNK